MKATRKLFVFLLILHFTSSIIAQQSPAEALNKLNTDFPQEKIYIWFNKPAYIAGETLWFKAYIFSGYELSFISSTLYVELYDANKKLISNKLFPLLTGVAEGSIDLDGKIDEGVYYIRAYTQWMLNFDESFQYLHQLLLYNPDSKKHLAINNSNWKAGVFPEGGSLIEGVETKVAVRRFVTPLSNTKWSGYLYDENDPLIKIKEFTALDENVALFNFIPLAGKKYFVNVYDEYGTYKTCQLPAVKNSGVNISVEDKGDSITYNLKFQNIPGNGNGYSIIGEIQHQLAYQASFKNSTGVVSAKIPSDQLGNGILHLTVFDPTNDPVVERLVFVNRQKLEYDSTAISQYYLSSENRAASEIQMKVDSISWSSYSVSIIDAIAPFEEDNLLSVLWLTSDISTPLQNGASYFRNSDKNKMEALDAIMISEKWQRFKWTNILNNKYPTISHIPLNFLSYTGKVKYGNKLKPKEEVMLMLYYPDSSTSVMLTQTDSVGYINMDNLVFYDDLKVFYQLNNKKSNAKLIDIDFERHNKFVPYASSFPETSYILSATDSNINTPAWVKETISNSKALKEIQNKKMLKEVFVHSKLKSPKEQLNEQLSTPRFRTTNETIFDFVNEFQTAFVYQNILQWLNGRVAGLSIGYGVSRDDPVSSLRAYIRGSEAAIFVDEIRMDAGYLNSLSTNDIAMIKVIKGSAYALQAGVVSGGIIAVYTNRFGLRTTKNEPSLPNNKIKGYDTAKKFPLPDYNDNTISQPTVDVRTQLLWQTLLVPDATSTDRSRIQFFNNDKATQFRVIVQGFTSTGFPVYYDKVIEPGKRSF